MENCVLGEQCVESSVWKKRCEGQCVESRVQRAVHVKDSVTKAKHFVMLCNLKACVLASN